MLTGGFPPTCRRHQSKPVAGATSSPSVISTEPAQSIDSLPAAQMPLASPQLFTGPLCPSPPPSSPATLPVVVVSGPRATCGIHQIHPSPLPPSHLFTRTLPRRRANLQQSRCTRAAAAATLENVQREEVGCPLSRDLGQRKAGGREASLLCVYLKQEPFTAVSRLVFIHRADTEQMRRDTSGSDVSRLERKEKKKRGAGGKMVVCVQCRVK